MTRRKPLARILSIAAAILILAGGLFGWQWYRADHRVTSTVSLDVNPSLEIRLDRRERVVEVKALNADGATVIGDMDFSGSDLDVTVNALIGSMLREGFLNDITNSILVSVDNDDPEAGAALQKKLAEKIDSLIRTDSFDGAVMSQTVSKSDDLDALAQQYGITRGKAQLIREITAQNTLYTFEALAPLSINELNLLSTSGNTQLEKVSAIGTASEKAYIGRDKAVQAALTAVGTDKATVTRYECEMDYDDGKMLYEVEFNYNGTEYEIDIDAVTGAVIERDSDRDDDDRVPSQSNATTVATRKPGTMATKAAYLTADEALNKALAHAGLSKDAIRELEREFDRDDGVPLYEIEFKSGNVEYKYDVHAESGRILEFEKDIDD